MRPAAVLLIVALCTAHRLPDSMRLRPRPPAGCPCSDPRLCQPVRQPAALEVFGFGSAANYSQFGWDVVSTIAWADQPELVCTAHAHNARVVAAAPGGMPLSPDPAIRGKWVAEAVQMVSDQHLDGITFDFESPLGWDDPRNRDYVALVNETRLAMHAALPGSQVSVCVAWAPDDIDGRAYDHRGLAAASDLLYVMVYDTQSQIFGRCMASANSPSRLYQRAGERYRDIGVPMDKVVLGVPWYGYDYPCLKGTDPTAQFCPITQVPFRGANCSDAAGVERSFSDVIRLLAHNATTARQFDQSTQSPYFNYRSTKDGSVHQVWFDDPASLAVKYHIAARLGARGVGPYRYDQLDYGPEGQEQTAAMWSALRDFKHRSYA